MSDKQNSLDLYVQYLENMKMGIGINELEQSFLNRYHNIISKQVNPDPLTNANDKSKSLALRFPKNNTSAFILTVTVLESTVLLGILISILALIAVAKK